MLIPPLYTIHSQVGPLTIYKRKSGTGTSGGAWLCRSCQFTSLAQAREYAEYAIKHLI